MRDNENPAMLLTHSGNGNISGASISLINSLFDYISFSGYELIDKVSIHTFECHVKTSMINFIEIYGCLRKYIIDRYNRSGKFANKLKYFPENVYDVAKTKITLKKKNGETVKCRMRRKVAFFPPINIDYGIRLFLHFYDNVGTIKLIVDPALLVASRQDGFNAKTYDYIQLAKRDDRFWLDMTKILNRVIYNWNIDKCLSINNRLQLSRVDITANIKISKNIQIPQLIRYYKRSLKRTSYRNVEFKYSGQDLHTMECMNLSQRFAIYDKSYEQYVKYGRSCPYKTMRMEYKIYPRRLYTFKRQMEREHVIYPHSPYHVILRGFEELAPFIMYQAIDRIFKDGDFYSRKAFEKLIAKETGRRKTSYEDIMSFMEQVSRFSSYENITKFMALYKQSHSANSLNYKLRFLKEKNVSAILMSDNDTKRFSKLPSIKSVFLSALINGYNSGSSDELDYIRSFLPDLPDQ